MLNKEVIGWSIYDLANTAFSALVISLFFPVLIKNFLGGNEFQIGLVMGLSLLLAGVFVPLLGGLSDATNVKKPFLIIFTILTVITTILIPFTPLKIALILGLLANFFYHSSLDIYDSFLPMLSSRKNIGKISGIGTAFGYVGTILSLVMAWILLNSYGWDTLLGVKAVFIGTGVFFLVFAIITFLTIKDRTRSKRTWWQGVEKSVHEVSHTVTKIKKHKNVWTFLLASFLYVDALSTAIIFLFLFGNQQIGLTLQQFFPLMMVMALTAGIGSLFFGKFTDWYGPKKTLIVVIGGWILVIASLMISPTPEVFYAMGSLGGAFLGGVWTATRPMLVSIAPKEKITELFGFQGLTEKFGGVIGPILFGFLVVNYGYIPALGSLLVMFTAGLLILLKVKPGRTPY